MERPRLAVHKFASCDGCQLTVLSLGEELLSLAQRLEISYFPEASSRMQAGPCDIALVEGSITTPEDAHRIVEVRAAAKYLITIGACATAGGIQALRNFAAFPAFQQAVYASPEYVASLSTSTPISEHVQVDYELWGCPIDQQQLLQVLTAVLAGTTPQLPTHSVCMECKRRANPCVLVTRKLPCLGPVTRTGCGAICPGMGRECYGCFGPAELSMPPAHEPANTRSLATAMHHDLGLEPAEIMRRFRGICGYVDPFKKESHDWED